MGFIYEIQSKYSRKCIENPVPKILTWAPVCILCVRRLSPARKHRSAVHPSCKCAIPNRKIIWPTSSICKYEQHILQGHIWKAVEPKLDTCYVSAYFLHRWQKEMGSGVKWRWKWSWIGGSLQMRACRTTVTELQEIARDGRALKWFEHISYFRHACWSSFYHIGVACVCVCVFPTC